MSLLIVNTIQPQTGSIVNISGSLQISQSLIVADDITLSGKLTLGNANTDNIVVNSEFTSSLIPDIDGAFDLGTGVKKWGTIFAKSGSFDNISGSVNLTNGLVTITSASISYLSGSSPITVGGEMIPDVTNTHNLGSAVKKFNDLFINDISASGDITSSGTGSFTGGINAMDATGSFGYISASGDISTSGTVYGITGSFGLIEGTITTAAQPNIISLGTIFNLSATNITSSGNITASSFQTNNITIGSSNISGVGQISASRVSASVGFEADTTSTSSFGHISSSGMIYSETNISASGIINSEGDISSSANIGAIGNAYNGFMPGTGSFGNVTASHTIHVGSAVPLGHGITLTHTGHISASRVSASAGIETDGDVSASGFISASGFDTRITAGTSADALFYTVNGRKVEVRNQVQAQVNDGTFSFFELRNTSIATDSIVLGSFTGNTITNITGSIITAATIALYTASVQIHNETGENITNDTAYTASFIIL